MRLVILSQTVLIVFLLIFRENRSKIHHNTKCVIYYIKLILFQSVSQSMCGAGFFYSLIAF